jgi:hypothetical protein
MRSYVTRGGSKGKHVYHDWSSGPRVWSRRASLERLDKLSTLLDIAFIVPGTNIRFGVEAILRLVPGIGDIAASTLSCWVLYEATVSACPHSY